MVRRLVFTSGVCMMLSVVAFVVVAGQNGMHDRDWFTFWGGGSGVVVGANIYDSAVWAAITRENGSAWLPNPIFIYAPLLYLALTLAFTFPSVRGSTLHSSAALLPFLAAAAPRGMDACVEWVARRRRTWDAAQAARVFRVGFVALAIFLAIYLYALGVFPIGGVSDIPLWNLRDVEYTSIARWLDQNAHADDVVMSVDPPAFYNASHHRAIAIPTDNVDAIFLAARRYGACYLVLQFDHPAPLSDLYHERVTIPGLSRVADFRDGNDRPVTLYKLSADSCE